MVLSSIAVLGFVVLTGCPANASPPSADLSAEELAVVSTESAGKWGLPVIDISPDGEHLLLYRETGDAGEFIIRSRSEGNGDAERRVRFDPNGHSIHWNSLSWSPDSRRVAFTENYQTYFLEPDIWVLDVVAGTVKNMTDDGVRGQDWARDPEDADHDLDILPTWRSEDELYFIRGAQGAEGYRYAPHVSSLSVDDADVNEQWRIPGQEAQFISSFHLVGDQNVIMYDVLREDQGSAAGIWRMNKGDEPAQLLPPDDELGPPGIASLCPAGRYAVAYYPRSIGNPDMHGPFLLLDIEEGRTAEITRPTEDPDFPAWDETEPQHDDPEEAADPDDRRYYVIRNATFSPDASKLIYTATDMQAAEHVLVVRDLEGGGAPNVLQRLEITHDDTYASIGNHHPAPPASGLRWRRDDTILIDSTGSHVLVLEIGEDPQDAEDPEDPEDGQEPD